METYTPGKVLRLLVAEGMLQVPGVPNALLGRLAEDMGFEALYLSGAAVSTGVFALPDAGLVTLTELAHQATCITRAVGVPLIVDAGAGFGAAAQVERTVVELEGAGAGALQLDDRLLPSCSGQYSGPSLVSIDEMQAKLRAAVAARTDDDTVIIARTDARNTDGLESAVARAEAYVDEGADWILPDALATEAEFAEFARRISVPLVANMTEFGPSPLIHRDALAEMGYCVALFPATLLRVAMKSCEAALAVLASEGSASSLLDLMQTPDELADLLGSAPPA